MMPVTKPKPYSQNKPWKALYKGKWYDVIDEEDQGPGKKNKYHLKGVPGLVEVQDIDPYGIGGSVVNKESIAAILEKRYHDKTREAIESVAADVFYSGEPAAVLASNSVLDRLFDSFTTKEIEAAKKKGASVDSNEFCPICKQATANIKLAEDRPAKWCPRHFVVFPVKSKA